jgi:hypothetical protein
MSDEREWAAKLAALRAAAQVGWDDLAAGRYVEVRTAADEQAVRDQIHARVDAIKQARALSKQPRRPAGRRPPDDPPPARPG